MSKSNPLKNIRADFLGHLKRFYKVDSSPAGRRHVEFLQDVVQCLPEDLREAYWDLQLVALACTYLADGGRIETLYRYGFSQNMVNAVRLLTPCYPPDEAEDGPGHFRYMLRLLRSRISCTVRYAMIAAARKRVQRPGVEVPSEQMLELFRGLADGELRFAKETPFFGQFAEFELGDRSYEDVRRDVCARAFRFGPFLEMLVAADWYPFVFDSETDPVWGRNRQGEGHNQLGFILRSALHMVLQTLVFCRWQPYADESQTVIWARAGWWHKITKTSDWVGVLAENPVPEFVRHCPFHRFSARDWLDLLRWQPKFFDLCHLSRKRDPEFWADVACLIPERLDDAHWARLSPAQWLNVLAFHPELSGRAPWTSLEAEDGEEDFVRGWGMLLLWQPRFVRHCRVWAKLNDYARGRLAVMRSEFRKKLAENGPLGRSLVDPFYGEVRARNEQSNRYSSESDISTMCGRGYFEETDCRSLVWFGFRRPILYRYCLKRVAEELLLEVALHFTPSLCRRCPKPVRERAWRMTQRKALRILFFT